MSMALILVVEGYVYHLERAFSSFIELSDQLLSLCFLVSSQLLNSSFESLMPTPDHEGIKFHSF